MNRVFIIGNGFDLAHGLPTSYNHFINDFWSNLHINFKEESIKDLVLVDELYEGLFNFSFKTKNFNDFIENIEAYTLERGFRFDSKNYRLRKNTNTFKFIFEFKSDFFLKINKNQSIDNWVDIENLYYYELKKIVKSERLDTRMLPEDWERDKRNRAKKLNEEFNLIKLLLVKYLKNLVRNYDFDLAQNRDFVEFYQLLKPISLYNNES